MATSATLQNGLYRDWPSIDAQAVSTASSAHIFFLVTDAQQDIAKLRRQNDHLIAALNMAVRRLMDLEQAIFDDPQEIERAGELRDMALEAASEINDALRFVGTAVQTAEAA